MSFRLSKTLRIASTFGLVIFSGGLGLLAYHYVTRPITLTIAAGSSDGEAAAVMLTIASRLASTNSHVRLKVVDSGTTLEASKAFSASQVDLAIVRADIGDLSAARTVVLLTHGAVMILVPPGSSLKNIKDLKGKTVGVVGGEANHRVVETLNREFDLTPAKVQFNDLALADVPKAIQSKQVSALLVVLPLTQKYLSAIKNFFEMNPKRLPGLIPIESAGAVANVARYYDSFDIPKGTLRGSPPIPDDDLTTLRVSFYLVANKKLGDDVVGELTKNFMDARSELLGTNPLLAQVSAPSTDKDAFIPIHPGAATYFSGDQKSFFDKYGDQFFYGSMLLGTLTSLLAGVWKFIRNENEAKGPEDYLNVLFALADRIRHARDESELAAVEEKIDTILKIEFAKHSKGESEAADTAALGLAAHRLEHLIDHRRSTLQSHQSALSTA
jgi:TRAP transporter TAXI family solute receptor